MKRLQLYVVPAGLSLVDMLAENLLAHYRDERELLSHIRILLPSHRAVRSLREAFLRATGGEPLLLPRIQPLGELDSGDIMFAQEAGKELLDELISIPEPMSAMRRLMILARLVWQMDKKIRLEQSAQMAIELARLLDAVEREELSFDRLRTLVPEDEYALHWQKVLEFLNIVSEHWPQYLAENRQMGAVARRSRLLHLLAEQWEKSPPDYPVIAAGTTGSVPATANLLKVIAQMPQGKVLLPGLDSEMPDSEWQQLDETHPQYGLKQLLETIGATRGDVQPFTVSGPSCTQAASRSELLRYALQPAGATMQWSQVKLPESSVDGMRIIECESVNQEAKVITLLMREALDHPEKTAALVTPDRALARRVISTFRRYNLVIDDSAGTPLLKTPSAVFLQLVIEMVMSRAAPVPLLSVLKHPLAGIGMPTAWVRETARQLELAALRGVRFSGGLSGLRKHIAAGNSEYKEECLELLDRMTAICAPVFDVFGGEESRVANSVALPELLELHLRCTEQLAASAEEDGAQRLWRGDKGELLASSLLEIKQAVTDFPPIDPASYKCVMDALLEGVVWRPKYGSHPRLHILSPMEARLQKYDLLILGGLNEGVWPQGAMADPWMSRPMRSGFGLPAPERAIGQSAHDFYMLAANQNVVLTRSRKSGGTMTIPSRWWARINAVLEKSGMAEKVKDERWKDWAVQLDKPEGNNPVDPPAPCPPVNIRPRRLSVTQIERLLRDPYSVYARYILRLKKLDPIDKDPGMADFGNMVHDALECFVKLYPEELPDDAYDALLRCGKESFSAMDGRPAITVFWWPRFERIARWIVDQEAERRQSLARIFAEIRGEYKLKAPAGDFVIHGRVDRIEKRKNSQGVTIVDYKTGTIPKTKDVSLGFSPQLLLEGLIAQEGSFAGLEQEKMQVEALEYWKLVGGADVAGKISNIKNVENLIAETKSGIEGLIAAFDHPEHSYLACPFPAYSPKYNDFSHLARIKEWNGSQVA